MVVGKLLSKGKLIVKRTRLASSPSDEIIFPGLASWDGCVIPGDEPSGLSFRTEFGWENPGSNSLALRFHPSKHTRKGRIDIEARIRYITPRH